MTDEKQNYLLFVAVSVDGGRYAKTENGKAKLAPAAYEVYSSDLPDSSGLWGQGYASDSHAYFAHGIAHAIDEIMMTRTSDFLLDVCVANPGVESFVKTYAAAWVEHEGKNSLGGTPNNLEVWRRVYVLSSLGSIKFRVPGTSSEKAILKEAQRAAKERAKKMPDCNPQTVDGITDRGELT